VVKAADCQCQSRNSPGFDSSILRHSGIWGAADEAVLNIVHRKKTTCFFYFAKSFEDFLGFFPIVKTAVVLLFKGTGLRNRISDCWNNFAYLVNIHPLCSMRSTFWPNGSKFELVILERMKCQKLFYATLPLRPLYLQIYLSVELEMSKNVSLLWLGWPGTVSLKDDRNVPLLFELNEPL
jgi:hypothetical protein